MAFVALRIAGRGGARHHPRLIVLQRIIHIYAHAFLRDEVVQQVELLRTGQRHVHQTPILIHGTHVAGLLATGPHLQAHHLLAAHAAHERIAVQIMILHHLRLVATSVEPSHLPHLTVLGKGLVFANLHISRLLQLVYLSGKEHSPRLVVLDGETEGTVHSEVFIIRNVRDTGAFHRNNGSSRRLGPLLVHCDMAQLLYL